LERGRCSFEDVEERSFITSKGLASWARTSSDVTAEDCSLQQVKAGWAWRTACTQGEKHGEVGMVRSSLRGYLPEEL